MCVALPPTHEEKRTKYVDRSTMCENNMKNGLTNKDRCLHSLFRSLLGYHEPEMTYVITSRITKCVHRPTMDEILWIDGSIHRWFYVVFHFRRSWAAFEMAFGRP